MVGQKRSNNVHQIFQGPVEHVAGRDVVVHNELGRRLWSAERQLLLDEIHRLQQQVATLSTKQASMARPQQIAKCWQGLLQLACTLMLLVMVGMGLQTLWSVEEQMLARVQRADCEFDGATYSWGARLTLPDGSLLCVKNRNGQYLWQPERG